MSVYTSITRSELEQFLQSYPVNALNHFQGISDGIENTNYIVSTLCGDYVLTIFETLSALELNQFIALQNHLSQSGFPSPNPVADRQGKVIQSIKNKPATLFTRLPGKSIENSNLNSCRQIGLNLAKLHLNAQNSVFNRINPTGLNWIQQQLDRISHRLSAIDVALLKDEISFQKKHEPSVLPQGIIHADLFKDNVLFCDDKVSGIVDFYNACHDNLILDIAITANDWCCIDGQMKSHYIDALLSGYETVRALNYQEKELWPVMQRRAALRFWLSRLLHRFYPRSGELTQQKDPFIFRSILQQHREKSL